MTKDSQSPGRRFGLLVAAPEVTGFAKTGGLADVAASLPAALAARGHQCVVMAPLYRSARLGPAQPTPTDHRLSVPVGGRTVTGRLWQAPLPGSPVAVYFVEQPEYFDRDDAALGRGIYQFTRPDGTRADYPDNCERFTFFSRAVLESLRQLDFRPDVVQANDWQTALVPIYLKEVYAQDPLYRSVRSLLTVHNAAYQGRFWHWDLGVTGLDQRLFNPGQLEFHGGVNLLKGGVVFADAVSTVSPTYAREIQTPEYGCGLDGVFRSRRDRLFGIVNGVDYRVWDPSHDPHLPARYDADSVVEGKSACKAALQRRLGLEPKPDAPLIGMVARLVEQKGIDLVVHAAEELLPEGVQFAVLGEGEVRYQQVLSRLHQTFPGRVGLHIGFDEALAHEIEAGADLFWMPSRFEPSGLNQLYSLRYGTVPVVRAVGGLADTVVDATDESLAQGTATGFRFVPYEADALLAATRRALALRCEHPEVWADLVRKGMRQDWSWDRSARDYERLFALLTGHSAG